MVKLLLVCGQNWGTAKNLLMQTLKAKAPDIENNK